MAAEISSPSLEKTFPGILNLKHPVNHLIDLTYFFYCIHSSASEHRLMQGYSLKKWKHIQHQIHFTSSDYLYIQCTEEERPFFKSLLEQSSKIKQILDEEKILTVQINHASKHQPISLSPGYDEENKIHKESILSHSLDFLPPDTTRYPPAFKRTLEQIYQTIKAGNPDLFVYLYGVDCLFFAYILRKSYRFCIQAVFLHSDYALHLYIKRSEDRCFLLKSLKEKMQEKQFSIKDEEEEPNALYLKKEKLVEKPAFSQNVFFSPCKALKYFGLPLTEISNQTYCLVSTYLAYCLHQIGDKNPPRKDKWKELWLQVDEFLPACPFHQNKKAKEEIQHLAFLKSSLEEKKFSAAKQASPGKLKNTDLCEVMLSYFRDGSTEPLNAIWINQRLLQVDAPEKLNSDLPLTYYISLIRSLAHSQNFLDFDYISFAHTLKKFKQGESIDRENPAIDILLLMLQAGSFPFFLHAHITITQKIAIRLQKNYCIKYMKPQRNATCEFFVSSPGNFTMIRTGIYIIQKKLSKEESELKGECVMKWTVSFYKGQWSFSIQFPAVRPNENCSPEEQKEIYKGFE